MEATPSGYSRIGPAARLAVLSQCLLTQRLAALRQAVAAQRRLAALRQLLAARRLAELWSGFASLAADSAAAPPHL